MLAPKKTGRHSRAGAIYYRVLWIVFATATAMAILRWKEDRYLFFLGLGSISTAFLGRLTLKRKIKWWPVTHIIGMGFSYIVLLIAFYLDNGRFLPVWKNLPPFLYWFLPIAIGLPIILRTLLHHRLSRHYFQKRKAQ
jgi:hypothetical protein